MNSLYDGYVLFFDKDETISNFLFKEGKEYDITKIEKDNEGAINYVYVNDISFTVGYNKRHIFNKGIEEAVKSLKKDTKDDLIDFIENVLYGWDFEENTDIDNDSNRKDILKFAVKQSMLDFSANHLFKTDSQRNEEYFKTLKRVYR